HANAPCRCTCFRLHRHVIHTIGMSALPALSKTFPEPIGGSFHATSTCPVSRVQAPPRPGVVHHLACGDRVQVRSEHLPRARARTRLDAEVKLSSRGSRTTSLGHGTDPFVTGHTPTRELRRNLQYWREHGRPSSGARTDTDLSLVRRRGSPWARPPPVPHRLGRPRRLPPSPQGRRLPHRPRPSSRRRRAGVTASGTLPHPRRDAPPPVQRHPPDLEGPHPARRGVRARRLGHRGPVQSPCPTR